MDYDRIIGEGMHAVVYAHMGRAVKQYRTAYPAAHIMREAMVLSMLEQTGLPIPRLYSLNRIQDRWTLEMDLVEGRPVAYEMEAQLEAFVDLQLKIHAVRITDHILLPNNKDICRSSIHTNEEFDVKTKEYLMRRLQSLPEGYQLCHNDYHGLNVMDSGNGLHVIDWTSAASGSPASDCCRTYAMTKIHHEPFAEPYLHTYCRKSGLQAEDILMWLPVISAEWLTRHPKEKNPLFTKWLSAAMNDS